MRCHAHSCENRLHLIRSLRELLYELPLAELANQSLMNRSGHTELLHQTPVDLMVSESNEYAFERRFSHSVIARLFHSHSLISQSLITG